jgi:heptosyltransferase-2
MKLPRLSAGAPILVRSPNWVGDAVMAMPFYVALARALPDCPISVAARPHAADIARLVPGVEVLDHDDRGRQSGLRGRLGLAGELRRRRFQAVFLLPNSFSSALLPFLARIPVRIGYAKDARSLLLTHRVPWTAAVRQMHRSKTYLHLLDEAGLGPVGEPGFPYRVGDSERQELAGFLAGLGVESGQRLIGVAPGAVGASRRWPAERYGQVALALARRHEARILVIGTAADRPLCQVVEQVTRGAAVNLAGKTPLRLLPTLIDRCLLLLANDSGAAHVASLTRTPTIVMHGADNEQITRPMGEHIHGLRRPMECAPCESNTCARGDLACMLAIEVADALALAEQLLGRG